ncbi:hypothetical protein PVAG01_03713 [Phlyctema vagabunda]|uniref:Uncharacterized protein n=1 Tax=Phlyctema vagabunda TaxID=108571 RepID=A0ABR4PMW5_9HELO
MGDSHNDGQGGPPGISFPKGMNPDQQAVYEAMLEELGQKRVESLPLADGTSSKRGPLSHGASGTYRGSGQSLSAAAPMISGRAVDQAHVSTRWGAFVADNKKENTSALQPEADGQLARIKKQQAEDNKKYTEDQLKEARALNASFSRGGSKTRGSARGRRSAEGSVRGSYNPGFSTGAGSHKNVANNRSNTHPFRGSQKQIKANEVLHKMARNSKINTHAGRRREANIRVSTTTPKIWPTKLATAEAYLNHAGFNEPVVESKAPKTGLASSKYATAQDNFISKAIDSPKTAPVAPAQPTSGIRIQLLLELEAMVRKDGVWISGKVANLTILSNGTPNAQVVAKVPTSGLILLKEVISNPALFRLDGLSIKYNQKREPGTSWQFNFQNPLFAKKAKDAVDDPVGFELKYLPAKKAGNYDTEFNPAPGPHRSQAWHDMNDLSNGTPLLNLDEEEAGSVPEDSGTQDMVSLMITEQLVDTLVADVANNSDALSEVQLTILSDPETFINPGLAAKYERVLENGLHSSTYADGYEVPIRSKRAWKAILKVVTHHMEDKHIMRSFSSLFKSFAEQLTDAVYVKLHASSQANRIEDSRLSGTDLINGIPRIVDVTGFSVTSQRSNNVTDHGGASQSIDVLSSTKGSSSLDALEVIAKDTKSVSNTEFSREKPRIRYTEEQLLSLRPNSDSKTADISTPTVTAHRIQSSNIDVSSDQYPQAKESYPTPLPAALDKPSSSAMSDNNIQILPKDGNSNDKGSISIETQLPSSATDDFDLLKKAKGGLSSSIHAPEGLRDGIFSQRAVLRASSLAFSGNIPRGSRVGRPTTSHEKPQKQDPRDQGDMLFPDINTLTMQEDMEPDSKLMISHPPATFAMHSASEDVKSTKSTAKPIKDTIGAIHKPAPAKLGLRDSMWAPPGALADTTNSYSSMKNSRPSSTTSMRALPPTYLPPNPPVASYATLGTTVDNQPRDSGSLSENLRSPRPTGNSYKSMPQETSNNTQAILQARLDQSLRGRL